MSHLITATFFYTCHPYINDDAGGWVGNRSLRYEALLCDFFLF